MTATLTSLRHEFHKKMLESILGYWESSNTINISDSTNKNSCFFTDTMVKLLAKTTGVCLKTISKEPQSIRKEFVDLVAWFIDEAFKACGGIRPGAWHVSNAQDRIGTALSAQYRHLVNLSKIMQDDPQFYAAFDGDYLIVPDVVVSRHPEPDEKLNTLANGRSPYVDAATDVAQLCPLRECNHSGTPTSIMHASISCKWTIRSDRSQNTKTEALNMVRNRKGRLPHVVVVTAEPMPTRLASVAMGTGDIDCTYHVALPELQASIPEDSDAGDMLKILVEGRRLRDISDLPLDLMT